VHVLAPIGPTRAVRGACVSGPGGVVATRPLRRPWTSARASMATAREPCGLRRSRCGSAGLAPVLGVGGSLAGGHERAQRVALVVLEALLVHGEVEVGDERGDLVEVVLEADGEPARVREVGDPPLKASCWAAVTPKPVSLA